MEDGLLPTIVAIGARDDRDAMRFLEKFKTNSDVEDCYVAPPRDVLSRKSGAPRNLATSLTKSHWGMEMVSRARACGARQGDRGVGDVALCRQTVVRLAGDVPEAARALTFSYAETFGSWCCACERPCTTPINCSS